MRGIAWAGDPASKDPCIEWILNVIGKECAYCDASKLAEYFTPSCVVPSTFNIRFPLPS